MNRVRLSLVCTLIITLLFSTPVTISHDDTEHLDITFGTNGKTLTDFTGGADVANALAIQPDGKIVVAGSAVNTVTSDTDFGLARYNSNGTLDPSFGEGGKVITDVGALGDIVSAIALQPDGKIVVAGQSFTATNFDFSLARYHANGTLDTSFGAGGKVLTDFNGNEDIAFALVIQPDGKLVVAGHAADELSDLDFALARYNPDGSLDVTFGTGGKVTTDFLTSDDQAFALVRQPDGKLLAGGAAINPDNSQSNFALARYDADGSLDLSFNTGKVITSFGGASSINALALLSNGKIVAAGGAVQASEANVPNHGEVTNDFALARYDADGTIDPTFGVAGKVTTDIQGEDDQINDIAVQADGKMVAAGVAIVGHREADSVASLNLRDPLPTDHEAEPSGFALVRYQADGGIDLAFGDGGKATTEIAHDVNSANAVAIQNDGRIIAAGQAGNPDFPDFGIARYASTTFDICIYDERSRGSFRFNSATGDYQMQDCRKGVTVSGRGVVTINSCKIELRDSGANPKRPDRSVTVLANPCTKVAAASVQMFSPAYAVTINDTNIADSPCRCP